MRGDVREDVSLFLLHRKLRPIIQKMLRMDRTAAVMKDFTKTGSGLKNFTQILHIGLMYFTNQLYDDI